MPRRVTINSTPPPPGPDFFSPHVAEARRFYLNLQPARSTRLVVVCGGLERCTPDYAIDRDSFPFYSIEYVTAGRGTLHLKNKSHALHPGLVFSYGPGISQKIASAKDAPLVKYFVDFAGTEASKLLRHCGLAAGQARQVFPASVLLPLFDELIRVGSSSRRESTGLCGKLLECLAMRLSGAKAADDGVETLAFTTFNQCRDYLQQHSLRLRTLDQVAQECHIDKAYLCRLFRRYDHQSPYQLLLRLKMNHAAERLQQPGAIVKQIAEETGFADPFHFSRVFKSVLGLSPSEFRALR
jgi:AraC-like DNA-binding protein